MKTLCILAVCMIFPPPSSATLGTEEVDPSFSRIARSLLGKTTDDSTEASSCYSCFTPGWGWSMGPFSGTPSMTYQFDMYRSNTNGCNREDGDPETLTGIVTLSVTDSDNDGNLEFHVIAQALHTYIFKETQVYVGTSQPSTMRPAPGQESSKCYSSGGSDSTCSSASGATQIHEINLDTASLTSIPSSNEFYFWIHAAETTTGETVYGRSGNGWTCQEEGLVSPNNNPVSTNAPVTPPTSSPVQAPANLPAPTSSPVQGGSSAGEAGSCFHSDGTVMLESGFTKPLSELNVGEYIKTCDANGKFSFSEVLVLPHAKNVEPAVFLNLATDSGKFVDMTAEHLIPKCDQVLVTAGELVVGDCLLTIDGKETLIDISSTSKDGVYTAVTTDTFIVVNGIVASAFSRDRNPEQELVEYPQYLESEFRSHIKNMQKRRHTEGLLSGLQKYLRSV